jgi:hypothetical protein
LITIYLAGAKNTDSWHARKEDLQRDSPLHVPMVPSPKLSFIANDNNPTGVGLAQGNTIDFGGLEFIADRFGHLSLSPSGEGLRCHVHRNGPQWVTFSMYPSRGVLWQGRRHLWCRGRMASPEPRGCNVVTSTDPIITIPVLEGTPALQTIPTVTV